MKKPIRKHKLELKNIKEVSSDFNKISCPSCQQQIPGIDININDKIAKCNSCSVVFSIEPKISNLLTKSTIKQEVIRPEGIDIFYFKNDLDITIQQPQNVLEILLAFFLSIFAALTTLLYFLNPDDKPPFFVPIIFAVAALPFVISLLKRKKHKIHIVVDDQELSIFRRPRKFVKDQHFASREIDQLYVKKVNHLYSIVMIVNGTEGQKHINLINNLDSISKAQFLEQEIENHLDIEDRKIPEEMR